mgnify:CR=1 FL=1
MNAIKSKLAIVIVLLLSVVILIPSASSKYVKSYRSILQLETAYSYYYVWYGDKRGSVSPTTYEITYNANDDSLKDLTVAGRYLIMVKGGNGGDGIDTVSGTFIEGGYGGVMAGIVDFDPKTQVLHVYLGNSGKDAMSGYSTAWANSSGGRNAVANLYVDAANTWKKADTLGGGGNAYAATQYSLATAGGGGGATLLFLTGLNEAISLDNLLLVSGGGGSAGNIVSGQYNSAGVGGSGGSNVISSSSVSAVFKNRATIDGATYAEDNTFGYVAGNNPGVVYFAWDGTSASASAYGSGATNTHGTLGFNRGSGMIAHGDAGYGGISNAYGGAGGGGFFGGTSGTTDLGSGASGGGGGGSSFFSKKVESVPLSTYVDNISAAFDQMGWLRCSSRPDGLLTVNADGTVIDNSHGHLEDYTYVVLAYVGPST